MNRIQQEAYFRQRVIKEVAKGRTIADTARLYHVSRMSIYRWIERYDGTVRSLYERSHRPKGHPNQQTAEELRLIRKVWSRNKCLGLVCLHMVLTTKYGYTRSPSTLNRTMKKLGIGRKKQRRKRHVPKPYETPKIAGEKVQIDVKYVPKECHVRGLSQMYQFTAVDECTRIRFRHIFEELSSLNAAKFLAMAQKYYPFRIQCVQTDNGIEFTNAAHSAKPSVFELYCRKEGIAHKRIRVATPRHNGKVERVHRIDQERFYADRSFYSVEDANGQLKRYQRKDNRFPLLVLGGRSPLQYWSDMLSQSVTYHLTT